MRSVLVVEDAPNWQRELKRILEKAGYTVFVAASSADVIRVLLEAGIPSLTVIDISLTLGDPGDRKGWEIMQRINNIMPVVCVSGYLQPTEVKQLYGQELAERFFHKKEFDEKHFLKEVEELTSSWDVNRKDIATKMEIAPIGISPKVINEKDERIQFLEESIRSMWKDKEVDIAVETAIRPYNRVIKTMRLVFFILLSEMVIATILLLLRALM